MRRRFVMAAAVALLAPLSLPAQRDTLRIDPARLPYEPEVHSRVKDAPSIRITNSLGVTELFGAQILRSGFAFDSARGLRLEDQLAFNERFRIEAFGSRAARGATIGGIALGIPAAIVGFAMGGLVCLDVTERSCDSTGAQFLGAVQLGVPGALLGAAIGGLLGSRTHAWQGVWSSPVPRGGT